MASPSAVNKIVSRGYSREHAERWLREHPGDEGRIESAFPTEQQAAPDQPPAASSAPAVGGAPPSVEGPMAGLTAATPDTGMLTESILGAGGGQGSGAAESALLSEPMAPTSVATETLSQLRNLGRRTPPVNTSALAMLRRVY